MRLQALFIACVVVAASAEIDAPASIPSAGMPLTEASGWSFRVQEGSSPQKGLLQVLPPHETEWGTVCGDTTHMNELLRLGKTGPAVSAAFFSPLDALVACRSAGFPVKRASAFRLTPQEGWGTGPSYMSHVSCGNRGSSVPDSLAECYFTLSLSTFLNGDCDRGDDVYLDCSNAGAATVDEAAELDDALAQNEDRSQQNDQKQSARDRRQFDEQDTSTITVPSSVIVVSLDTNASIVKSVIASIIAYDASLVTVESQSASTSMVKQVGNGSVTYSFGYFKVSFKDPTNTPAPAAAGSDTGGTTLPPSTATADTLMLAFIGSSSAKLKEKHIYELRPSSKDSYGTISDNPNLIFQLEAPSEKERFGAANGQSFGYLRATTDGNAVGASVCNVSSDNKNRFITASWICGFLNQNTIPSLLIPHFGEYNLGYMGIAELKRVANGYTRQVSTFYSKSNLCSNTDGYGIICGAGNFELPGEDAPPQQVFCVLTTVYSTNAFDTLKRNAYRELMIAPYRILKISDDSGKLCFRIQFGYAFKDNTTTLGFSLIDIQNIIASMNTEGWKMLTGSNEVYEISVSNAAVAIVEQAIQPVVVTFMTNLTAAELIQEILDYFDGIAGATLMFVDREDIILESNETIPGSLPQEPKPTTTVAPTTTAGPTNSPVPPAPPPTRLNRKNKTQTITAELTLTVEQTATLEMTPTDAEKNVSTPAPPTVAPTDAPVEETVNIIALRFMFATPAFEAVSLVENKTLLPWSVFTYGAPQLITPPPPPPDHTPLITGLVFAGLIVLILLVVAAVFVKKLYYTRTPKRWDDDYVMMNTQVLTIPLNTIEMETPVRRQTAKAADTGDRDTADLF